MIRLAWLPLILVLAGCGGLPDLLPTADRAACATVSDPQPRELVHSIEAVYPDGTRGLLVGATAVFPRQRRLECTLMTVEGFVLFAATDAETVTVHRALPPFDRPGFAAGLLADVRLMLLEPEGVPAAGRSADGRTVCRYRAADGRTTDVIHTADGRRIEHFDPRGRLRRTVTISETADASRPERITLQAHGPGAYRLTLNRIAAASPAP